ncbi:hypothetical protein RND81_10G005400 [Saponaria officinalis]|uniref:RING-type domain-containing protein n=1 Tax=Saponaria officinalis TaxID=3572 RepID=A0AAW1HXU1_SAPOF
MSATVSRIPANQDRPLLLPSPLPSDQRGGERRRMLTLLDLLTVEKMDGLDRRSDTQAEDDGGGGGGGGNRWRFLKQRLGLIKIVGCCGVATWRYDSSSPQFLNDDENDTNHPPENDVVVTETNNQRRSGINLAAALAAEREYRTTEEVGDATPSRVSLMRLLEETADGGEVERENKGGERKEGEEEEEEGGSERVCCVCMGRKKGAALIPCGHTYCRHCSQQLWLQRGTCPLCNHRILEILHIF